MVPGLTLAQALRSPRVYLVVLAFAIANIGIGGFLANFVPIFVERGVDVAVATGMSAVLLVSIMLGRFVAGFLLDRVWPYAVPIVLLGLTGLAALTLVSLGAGLPVWLGFGLVILFGLAQGSEGDFPGFFLLREAGPRHYAVLGGWVFALVTIPVALGGFLFGLLRDATGDYAAALIIGCVMYFTGAALVLVMGLLSRAHIRHGGAVYVGRGAATTA